MAITSYVEDEHQGRGRGHTEHGNGKGLGHQKHADKAMSDGVYDINISGINVVNNTATSVNGGPVTLADGSVLTTEVRDGSITISDAPNGDSALHLVTNSDGGGRLRVNVAFDADQQITLGELDQLSFDYYIASSSRTDVAPVLRVAIDADGDLSTTADRGELVFEYAYQGMPATTVGSWQTADLAGGDWNAWQRSNGANRDVYPDIQPLSEWADEDGFTPTGGITFDEDSVVLGFSVALGSGNGVNDAYVANLQVGGVGYDFV